MRANIDNVIDNGWRGVNAIASPVGPQQLTCPGVQSIEEVVA